MTWLRHGKNRKFLLQIVALASVAFLLVSFTLNVRTSLNALGITSGFSYLWRSTGWDLSFTLIDYDLNSSYGRAFLVGFLNTIFAGLLSLAFATVLGTMIGMARVSQNMTLRIAGTAYVEVFRNVPLLLQALCWYALLTHLPTPRAAEPMLGSIFVTARGVYLPLPQMAPVMLVVCVILALVIIAGVVFANRKRGEGGSILAFWLTWIAGLGMITALFLLTPVFLNPAGVSPFSIPALNGLRISGGMVIVPELSALIVALVVFGAAYIGEIVRGGLMSVKKGQIEAARSLGLSAFDIYWKIRFPLALRAIIPPLGNQYIWLLKGTTIGLAIGFSDLFMVSSTSINQSGQTIEILGLMMLGYFVINYTIGLLMNMLNRSLAIKGHNAR